MGIGNVGAPDGNAAQQHEGRPVLHNVHGYRSEVTAGPAADVLTVELVLDELAYAADKGEQLDGTSHEEELVRTPDVVHVERCDLICVHAFHDVVPERVADQESPIQNVNHQHEGHHSLVVEVEVHLEKCRVVVEANPEERRPEPDKVRQIVHGNDEPAPPLHLVGEGTGPPEALADCGDQPQDKEAQAEGGRPDEELDKQVSKKRLVQLIAPEHLEGKTGMLHPVRDGASYWKNQLFEGVLGQDTQVHQPRLGTMVGHKPEQPKEEHQKANESDPKHPGIPLCLAVGVCCEGEPLQAQCDGALDPTLLSSDEVGGGLCHPEGELPVHKVRVAADEDLVKAARGVLDLAAGVELLTLDELVPLLAVLVAHALAPLLPDGVVIAGRDQPHAVGAAGADPSAAVPYHGIEAEELGVVVVHIVGLVRILRVVLRRLREGHLRVQLTCLGEEAGNAGEHEVRLKLVAGVRNGVEHRCLVPFVSVLVPAVVDSHVVVYEVQATGLAVAGSEGHVVVVWVVVGDSVDHLLAVCPQLQPLLGCCTPWHLVVPGPHSDVLHHDVSSIFMWLGPGCVVHPEGEAVRVLRCPVTYVIKVSNRHRELVVVGV
mmetsp:Transcript_80544/g.181749  ORF Transcript_80544/g.181749 Transcript_80544/m.181749 type:complete len:601 (+) Transcript_80544:474-2276(+)